MSVNVEKTGVNEVKLTVEVTKEVFNEALDHAFKEVIKKHKEPGFRKGKMPKPIFIKKYGEEVLYEEAINHVLQSEYPKAVDEAGIYPVDQPNIDINWDTVGKDKDFSFSAIITVKPEVVLGQYKGIEVEELSDEVTDEEVTSEINKLLEQHAELIVKEDEVASGDTAVIDFEGFKDGEAFEGGKGENYPLVIGSNSFIPGFEEQLIGMKTNDTKEVNVTFPEEYHAEDLKGQPVVFKVTINEVKTRELPELNDDFVKDLNRENIDTVDQLTEDVKAKAIERKETAAKNHLIDKVVEGAANNAEFEVPEAMIKGEVDRMIQETEQRLQSQGMSLDIYLQYTGGNIDAFREQMKGEAEKRIRFNLTLEAIAKAENIEISAEDLNKQYEKMAEMYKIDIEQVKSFVNPEMLEDDLKIQKAVDLLVDNAVKK